MCLNFDRTLHTQQSIIMVTVTLSTTITTASSYAYTASLIAPTAIVVPTSVLTTITIYVFVSTVLSSSVFTPSIVTSTTIVLVPTTVTRNIDVFPRHAAVLIYFFSAVYGVFNGWLVWYAHREGSKRKVYIVFFISSVLSIVFPGIATVLSALKFGGNIPVKNIWGATSMWEPISFQDVVLSRVS